MRILLTNTRLQTEPGLSYTFAIWLWRL